MMNLSAFISLSSFQMLDSKLRTVFNPHAFSHKNPQNADTASTRSHAMISDALLQPFHPLKLFFRHYIIIVEPRTSLRNWSPNSVCPSFFTVYTFIKTHTHKTSSVKCGDPGSPHTFRYYKEYLFPRSNQPP